MRLVIRETLLSFRRAPVLSGLSITTIAFALFVVGLFGLVEMLIFILILLVGYVYAWKKGALEWE